MLVHSLLIESVYLCRLGGSPGGKDFLGNNFDGCQVAPGEKEIGTLARALRDPPNVVGVRSRSLRPKRLPPSSARKARSSMKFRTGSRSSRCEIQNTLAMLEVCWDRHVVVYNQPDAIDSPEARCPTQPQVGDVTASQRKKGSGAWSHI
jgi:hypothetical protein